MAIKNFKFYSNFYLLNFLTFLAPFSIIILSISINTFAKTLLFNNDCDNIFGLFPFLFLFIYSLLIVLFILSSLPLIMLFFCMGLFLVITVISIIISSMLALFSFLTGGNFALVFSKTFKLTDSLRSFLINTPSELPFFSDNTPQIIVGTPFYLFFVLLMMNSLISDGFRFFDSDFLFRNNICDFYPFIIGILSLLELIVVVSVILLVFKKTLKYNYKTIGQKRLTIFLLRMTVGFGISLAAALLLGFYPVIIATLVITGLSTFCLILFPLSKALFWKK